MRIIGGKHRSRQLKMVGKRTTRETADMVRESVFNMLGGTVSGVVLDLFAGSGSYGLEAISRGASHATFVDSDVDAIKTIKDNALLLKEEAKTTLVVKDAFKFLSLLKEDQGFDLVFIDPPYEMDIYQEVIRLLTPFIHPEGLIVCESKKQILLPNPIGDFEQIKDKTYGIKRITIYQKKA
jgi:16S rRNA (guanine(966)-N(2))-methyltransferase RsmD